MSADSRRVMSSFDSPFMKERDRKSLRGMWRAVRAVAQNTTVLRDAMRQSAAGPSPTATDARDDSGESSAFANQQDSVCSNQWRPQARGE
ncbi:hypothetical protein [Arthrobacter sp. NA-172]|uniref:hypothetical protein n=1 Tax=Arthrobacter sp. NA-172 TaxID=3367524 RepID=UPI00375494E5